MPKRTRDYHSWLLKQLEDPREAARYLNVAKKDSREVFLNALRNVAEAHKMAKVAAEVGVARESLYKTLSKIGNPRLSTFNSILDALGIDCDFKPKAAAISTPPSTEPHPPALATESTGISIEQIESPVASAKTTDSYIEAIVTVDEYVSPFAAARSRDLCLVA